MIELHRRYMSLDHLGRYSVSIVSRTAPTSVDQHSGGVLDECRSSPGLLLALLGHVAMRRLREVHTSHGLTPRQFQLLGALHDHGAFSQRELGVAMGTDPSILVTMLNPLELAGLISRDRDPEDRRCHVVTLTPAGRKQLIRALRAQREAEDDLFAGLDRDQREELRLLLIALQDSLAERNEAACALCDPSGSDSHDDS
jgi:DNA-binding MarR family transcriptional regulator